MNFLNGLIASATTPEVQASSLWITFNPRGTTLFAIFEGIEDIQFYPPMLRHHIPSSIKIVPFPLKGKKTVMVALREFNNHFPPNPRALFFLDRDFDDFLGISLCAHPYTYVTDHYSIESEFCNAEFIETFLRERLRIHDPTIVEGITNTFLMNWASFVDKVKPMMAWMLAARRLGLNASFGNIKMGTFCHFDTDANIQFKTFDPISTMYRLLEERTSNCKSPLEPVPESEIHYCISTISTRTEPLSWIRGKQVVWFLVKFLSSIQEQLSMRTSIKFEQVQLSVDCPIGELVAFIRCPASLINFLSIASNDLQSDKALPVLNSTSTI
jgi:hypothetical protein